jgi:hypothetical protein
MLVRVALVSMCCGGQRRARLPDFFGVGDGSGLRQTASERASGARWAGEYREESSQCKNCDVRKTRIKTYKDAWSSRVIEQLYPDRGIGGRMKEVGEKKNEMRSQERRVALGGTRQR